ncbi:hypothetical protein [Lactiplantibacillus plantarum]|uniref:hypothetical protein n=1 Tax=Lactiplantibacillus plantarum TaxID=1590 RepID=UPI000977F813|nr:hypothetical protein [Lactiplantibacillus plantarum]MCG0679873.1 hypothetical protein [Lactiplantibacillus plantarum]
MSTKKVQLKSSENNPDLGLSKDEPYYPITSVDAIKGLGEKLQGMAYQPATIDVDGLMSKEDKQKLDAVTLEPLSDVKLRSPDGSIFMMKMMDNGSINITKEGNDDGTISDK